MTFRKVRLATLGATCLLAALLGCSDDNPVKPNLEPKYLPSSTPQNVIENLRRAYTTRDSAGYDSLFDDAYAGMSIDNSGPGPSLTFNKADESAHIGALARTPTIVSVVFNYGPNPRRSTDVSDSAGWASLELTTPTVIVADGPNVFFTPPNTSMFFKFRPTAPASGSPTDTTWKIVRWLEIAP
jgi:hypothetical protein